MHATPLLPLVTTLIAPPNTTILNDRLIASVESALSESGAERVSRHWLAAHQACDVFSEGLPASTVSALIGDVFEEYTHPEKPVAVDHITQPVEGRRKELLICDMDSTIITVECIDEIADFAGVKAKVAGITERAMNGELDFKEALRERVALLKGLPVSVLEQTYQERIRFTPGARELVATMRANGATCLLVSGGFTYFTHRVGEALGFHDTPANQLEIADGFLTGKVVEPILDKEAKLHTLKEQLLALGLSREAALAVGDGANDLPMLLHAGLGVAYHAKPTVQHMAGHRINHTDLSSLLFAQGYRPDEFVR